MIRSSAVKERIRTLLLEPRWCVQDGGRGGRRHQSSLDRLGHPRPGHQGRHGALSRRGTRSATDGSKRQRPAPVAPSVPAPVPAASAPPADRDSWVSSTSHAPTDRAHNVEIEPMSKIRQHHGGPSWRTATGHLGAWWTTCFDIDMSRVAKIRAPGEKLTYTSFAAQAAPSSSFMRVHLPGGGQREPVQRTTRKLNAAIDGTNVVFNEGHGNLGMARGARHVGPDRAGGQECRSCCRMS